MHVERPDELFDAAPHAADEVVPGAWVEVVAQHTDVVKAVRRKVHREEHRARDRAEGKVVFDDHRARCDAQRFAKDALCRNDVVEDI